MHRALSGSLETLAQRRYDTRVLDPITQFTFSSKADRETCCSERFHTNGIVVKVLRVEKLDEFQGLNSRRVERDTAFTSAPEDSDLAFPR